MNTMRTLILVLAAMGACGGSEQPLGSANPAGAASSTSRELGRPVSHRAGDPALALVGGAWKSLGETATLAGASEVRAQGRGSVVAIGDTSIWLRSGARMAVAEDAAGLLRVDLREGQARVLSPAGAQLLQGERAVPMAAMDVLLSRSGAHTAMFSTRQRPEAASWSLELDEAPEPRGVGLLEVSEDGLGPLQLRTLSVSVSIEGGMALTEVEHVFYNADISSAREPFASRPPMA